MTHTPTAHTDCNTAYSHLVDDTERMRTAALRKARSIDADMSSLRHAIEHGRTEAALSLLETIDRANRSAIAALTPDE